MKFSIRIATLGLAVGLWASTNASALTISTRAWKADSFQTFSSAGYGSCKAANVVISAVGNTEQLADTTVIDPETGLEETVPVFRFPVTKSKVSLFKDGHLSKTKIGWTARSGLKFTRGSRELVMANFETDFVNKILYADMINASGTSLRTPLFTFEITQTVYSDFSKGYIVAKGSIRNMVMTPQAAEIVGNTLGLSRVLRAPLATLDWGQVDVDVSSKTRLPLTKDKALTASDVGIVQTTTP